MSLIDEINQFGSGAKFVRADLHIHSFGEKGSYDVKDENMIPKKIIDTAMSENLQVISITDHNSIGNIEEAVKYSKDKPILVIPGVEITTIQGHLLLYFSNFENLNDFFGKLTFSDDKRICNEGIVVCLNIAERYNGFGIAAHIDADAGFDKTISKDGPAKEEIVKHKNLLGIEITDKNNKEIYSSDDDNQSRRQFFNLRKKILCKEEGYELAKLMSSDSHDLKRLGLNASGNKKLTRIKMDELTFDSFRIALCDPISRIRLEELIPNNVPHFVGIKIEGGFLNNQIVMFSKNLTCIIGGRGSGKSTLLESVRVGSGNKSDSNIVNSEVWPDRISLIYQDETGRQQTFVGDKDNKVINITDTINGIIHVPIESYGQGETAAKIHRCDKDPNILLSFFDDFIDVGDLKSNDATLIQKLRDNQSVIEKLMIDIKGIPELEKLKKDTDSKIKSLKEQNVGELVKYHENLNKGRTFRENLITDTNTLIKNINNSLSDKSAFNKITELDGSSLIIGRDDFDKIIEIINNFSKNLETKSNDLKDEMNKIKGEIEQVANTWKIQELKILNKIDEKKKELSTQGIFLNLTSINKVFQDSTHYEKKLKELYGKKENLESLKKERKKLIDERKGIKNEIFKLRYAWGKKINGILKNTVTDFSINIKFKQGLLSSYFQDFIKDKMSWKTSQVPKARLIGESTSPFTLYEGLNSSNINFLSEIKDNNSENQVFSKKDIDSILQTLNTESNKHQIVSIPFEDCPEITVTKADQRDNGSKKYTTKTFSKLSLGQQQSILLTILLYSKSQYPLIVDQPEDNLDSEFIYKTIVKNLKIIKEQRQVIIATHNANIAVLGDAELIIPLKSTSDKALIMDRGSIDNQTTKKITCAILEGSKEAFEKRKNIYGID